VDRARRGVEVGGGDASKCNTRESVEKTASLNHTGKKGEVKPQAGTHSPERNVHLRGFSKGHATPTFISNRTGVAVMTSRAPSVKKEPN